MPAFNIEWSVEISAARDLNVSRLAEAILQAYLHLAQS